VYCVAGGRVLCISFYDPAHDVVVDSLKEIDWHRIADLMWHEMTIQDACKELGYDESKVMKEANLDRRTFLLDTSMLASVREKYLNG